MSVVFLNCLVMVTLVIQRRFSLLYSHRMPFCRNKVKWNCDIVMFGYCWGGLKLRKARYCAIGRGQDHEESLSRVFQFIKQNALEMGLGRLPNFKKLHGSRKAKDTFVTKMSAQEFLLQSNRKKRNSSFFLSNFCCQHNVSEHTSDQFNFFKSNLPFCLFIYVNAWHLLLRLSHLCAL